MNRTLLAGAAVAAALAASAAPAHADSIAYLKGGDVFLSTADGTRQYQVTTGGGYASVSQSDAGTIVAAYDDRIRTLDRVTGAVVHDIKTFASRNPGSTFAGPFDPVVSPDGQRVAFSWYYTQYGNQPGCQPPTCTTHYSRQGTGFSRLDRVTGMDDLGYQSQTGWVSPSWLDDGSVISSDPIQVGNEHTAQMFPGDELIKLAGGTFPWFTDDTDGGAIRSMRDVERNPARTGFAGVVGDASEGLRIYRPGEDYPKKPTEACFHIGDAAGKLRSPSWNTASTRLAWSDDAGVQTIAIPDLTAGCGTPTEPKATLLIPGGQLPDWGPADVPPARPDAPGGPGVPAPEQGTGKTGPAQGQGKGQGGTGTGPRATAGAVKLSVARTSRRKAARRGLVVRITGATPGRHTVAAKAGRTVLARAKATVSAAGTGKATLRFKRSALRRGTVKLKVTGAGAAVRVTLR